MEKKIGLATGNFNAAFELVLSSKGLHGRTTLTWHQSEIRLASLLKSTPENLQ